MIILMAKLKAQPGKEALLAEECVRLAREVREKEKGCITYTPHVSVKDPSEVVFYEQYADQEARDIHRQTPHFQSAFLKFNEILAGPPEITVLRELK